MRDSSKFKNIPVEPDKGLNYIIALRKRRTLTWADSVTCKMVIHLNSGNFERKIFKESSYLTLFDVVIIWWPIAAIEK